jgi:hypothetical protein
MTSGFSPAEGTPTVTLGLWARGVSPINLPIPEVEMGGTEDLDEVLLEIKLPELCCPQEMVVVRMTL